MVCQDSFQKHLQKLALFPNPTMPHSNPRCSLLLSPSASPNSHGEPDREYEGECLIHKASKDSLNHIFSFLERHDIAQFSVTSKKGRDSVAIYELDRVRFVAWIDTTRNFHIERISSTQKQLAQKNLSAMTCVKEDTRHGRVYFLVPRTSPFCQWAMFIHKPLR